MPEQDYYEVLGVNRDVDNAGLKKAYKRLVMKYHPDRNPDADKAQQKLKVINRAYDVLSDAQQRQIYDHYGHEGLQASANGGGGGGGGGAYSQREDVFGDIFSDFFSSSRQSSSSSGRSRRGSDIRMRLSVDFHQAVLGHVMDVPINAPTTCDACSGNGMRAGSTPTTCSDCNGAGAVRMSQGFFSVQQECMRCAGSGRIIDDPCTRCDGTGSVHKKRTVRVNIPAGIDDDNILNMRGEGVPSPHGGVAGDLQFVIEVRPHELFERQGADLYCKVPVSISDLALGSEVRVPTIDGEVAVKLPAGMQSGKRLRLSGKGVPHLRGKGCGDLYCTMMAETPTRMSGKYKTLLKELSEHEDERSYPERVKWTKSSQDFSRKVANFKKK